MRQGSFDRGDPAGAGVTDRVPELFVYRASRLEALLDPLLHLLDTCLPADVLAPQTVIAAHPGMRQWLSGALARKRGLGAIVANLDIKLPSTWLDRFTQAYLGESAVALKEYRSERLRWRIHELLPALPHSELASCLQGGGAALRRFQLADRLANLFVQYVMYRPDWLVTWQDGKEGARNAGFQPELWRRLRSQIALPHRGELLEQLIEQLETGSLHLPQDPVHVFGISHMAPAEMRLVAAMARHRPVFLYVPDPSAKYWGDAAGNGSRQALAMGLPALATQRQALGAGDAYAAASESLFLDEVSHPLLASWGRMGQHFMLALEDRAPALDVRHWKDETPLELESLHPILTRVQASIRELDPSLPLRAGALPDDEDRSLQVHSCHTRLRELEVLRDALLAARSEIPDLKPADIAVMAPNMAAYMPLLGSVFGPAGSSKVDLPYHLADVRVGRTHPIFTAFTQLLAFTQSRVSAPEIADLLRIPQVAAARGIDAGGVETISQWLARTGVAWGLDGDFRAKQFGVPPIEEFGFAWGVERMLAGYVFGQEAPGRAFSMPGPAGANDLRLWPIEGIEGPSAALLGALDAFLLMLASLHQDAAIARSASAWSARLLVLVDECFRIDRRDRDAREALAALRGIILALQSETEGAGDPTLPFEVVRDVLLARLEAVSERQHLLMGGITFCGMVAARALPFRVVAVLGLNDGEFPRQAQGAGLDLTLQPGNRRVGDRDVRMDDRYLFLETLMAARERLHLSYIGEGVQDGKPRNPAAPLAELMAFLDRGTRAEGLPLHANEHQTGDETDAGDAASGYLRPWLVRHPLQPFDARYFQEEGRLFSFDAALADTRIGSARAKPFVSGRCPRDVEPDRAIPLGSVIAWFKDPAKQVLTSVLQLRLDALEEGTLAADEPMEAGLSAIDRIPRRLAMEALLSSPAERQIPADPPEWLGLTGKLPPGRLGVLAWAGEKGACRSAVRLLDSVPAVLQGLPLRRTPQRVLWQGDKLAVSGELANVLTSPANETLWLFDAYPKAEKDLEFKQRIPLFLQWAMLRLQTPMEIDVRICVLVCEENRNPSREWRNAFATWCDAFAKDPESRCDRLLELSQRVQRLVDLFLAAQRDTVWYFPKASWASRVDDSAGAVASAWAGDRNKGEMDYGPGYAALLARGMSLDATSSDSIAAELTETARMLDKIIHLDREWATEIAMASIAEVSS